MKKEINEVEKHYDINPLKEWNRLQKQHPYEKYITTAIMNRYIKPNAKILDIGGGPGHYSIYYALKGHEVTLFDLSHENVKFAKRKARQYHVSITAVQGNALDLSAYEDHTFDVVFLMGPLYHLLDEEDRLKAICEAKRVLKPSGYLFSSFISNFGGIIYCLREGATNLIFNPKEKRYFDAAISNLSISGETFTYAYFASLEDIKALFAKVDGLSTINIFGQESILAPYRYILAVKPKKEQLAWYDYAVGYADQEAFLTQSEHIMVIAMKK